jgi:hypothetical protein
MPPDQLETLKLTLKESLKFNKQEALEAAAAGFEEVVLEI